jgi:hypothetical protein
VTYCARELPKVSTVGVHCDWETHADSIAAHRPTIRTCLAIGSLLRAAAVGQPFVAMASS